MNWAELKNEIYYCDGSLRDIYVFDTNIYDNKKWTELVNNAYKINWFNSLTQTYEKQIDFGIVRGYLNKEHDLCSRASIFVDNIQINNHFFIDTKIENDISPTEINSIQDHEKVISYMMNISNALNKTIILTPENEPETILIKVINDFVELMG